MSEMPNKHEKLNYVEFATSDLSATKHFFSTVFNWQFTDYGEQYSAFDHQGLDGGFYQAELASKTASGGALLVFYSENLANTQAKIEAAGGEINVPVFDFPGGRRFHFIEPSGNEFAVWSDR